LIFDCFKVLGRNISHKLVHSMFSKELFDLLILLCFKVLGRKLSVDILYKLV